MNKINILASRKGMLNGRRHELFRLGPVEYQDDVLVCPHLTTVRRKIADRVVALLRFFDDAVVKWGQIPEGRNRFLLSRRWKPLVVNHTTADFPPCEGKNLLTPKHHPDTQQALECFSYKIGC